MVLLADAACAFNIISNVMMNGICCYYQHESKKTDEERFRTSIHNEYSVAVQHYKDRISQLEREKRMQQQQQQYQQELKLPERRRHRDEQRQCHDSVVVGNDDVQRRTQLMMAKQQALQEQQQQQRNRHPSSASLPTCRPSPLHHVDSLLSVHSLSLEEDFEVESYESDQFVQ